MTAERTAARSYREAMEGWVAAINCQDVAGMVATFTEDVQFEDIAMGRVCRGRSELEALVLDWMERFAETRAVLVSTHTFGNTGVTEWELMVAARQEASQALPGCDPDGRLIRLRGACIDELAPDGRIAKHRDYWNTADLTTS
jgi:steroid delta-isomerase-like uncharacterized protein